MSWAVMDSEITNIEHVRVEDMDGGGCSWRGEGGMYGDNRYTEGCDTVMY